MRKNIQNPASHAYASDPETMVNEEQRRLALLKTGALQNAIFNSANFSSIATDESGVIQIFNVGAERMLGYTAADVVNKITPAEISDPKELITRARTLSQELAVSIKPGFEALVFKASRGIEDIYELTYVRKDGSRFPAVVSVTALRDAQDSVIGYLLIGTDNTARKQAEEALHRLNREQRAISNCNQLMMRAENEEILLNEICRIVCEEAGYRMAWVGYTQDDAAKSIRVVARAGVENDYIEQGRFTWADTQRGRGPVGTAIRSGDSACIQDFSTDPTALPWRVSALKQGYYSSISLPIKDEKEKAFGILNIYSTTPNAFTPEEILLLKELSGDLAFGIRFQRTRLARRQAEEALLKAGPLQNAIFNSAYFSSIATDAKGVIQIFNVGAERMLGYKAADVVNKITPADISDPQEVVARAKALSIEQSTAIKPGFEALVFKASRGIEDIYELTYIRKDGSRFPAVVSVTALRDAQDTIIGYLLIGTDNTARKLIEAEQKQLGQRLRDQQFYTRSLFESNIDALMTSDPSGIITDVNKQMEGLTGCTRDELIGAPFKNYFTDPERAETSIKQVLSEKKVTNFELTVLSREGKQTVVSLNATTFYDRDRRLQGVFAAARDITERNLLDQALKDKNVELEKARAAADKANQAKSEFLSSMSHELRSPLNAILGFAQLMEADSPPPNPAQSQSIAQILQAGWHLLKLIDEILDLAKVESGQVPLSLEPVSLSEVLNECQNMVEIQAQQRGIKLIFPRPGCPYFVHADRIRVIQVLINLLSNAIKYNSKQGTIKVECKKSTSGRIRLSIRDTGAGLNSDQIGQLFQAFNRLGQEAGGIEGTGIGLVVAKRLVELMGGVIGVESVVDVGSTFWFELLAVAEPLHARELADTAELPLMRVLDGGHQHTLLYVEDNPANLKLVEQIISRHPDLHLLTAINGMSGIEMARASQPEVILFDINLPDITGFEALKILHSDSTTAHIPVVALSANAMPRDIKKGLELGFFRYLTKPIKLDEFMDALYIALEFRRNKCRSEQIEW